MASARTRLESHIEQQFLDFCTSLGIICKKLVPIGESGWPDRTLMYKGQVAFVELKRAGEVPTKLQLFCIERLRSWGFTADWSDDLEEMKSIVTRWKRHVDNPYSQDS